MNPSDELYKQRIKEMVLKAITSIAIISAVIASANDASPNFIIVLLVVAAIQWHRAERAARRIKEINDQNAGRPDITNKMPR